MSHVLRPTATTLVTAGWDHTLRLWDVATGRSGWQRSPRDRPDYFFGVTFSPDGKRLASLSAPQDGPPGSLTAVLMLWDVAERKPVATIPAHADRSYSVLFTPDGQTLVTASMDRTIKIWNVATREHTATLTSWRRSPRAMLQRAELLRRHVSQPAAVHKNGRHHDPIEGEKSSGADFGVSLSPLGKGRESNGVIFKEEPMKKTRITLARLMGVVAVVAVDLAAFIVACRNDQGELALGLAPTGLAFQIGLLCAIMSRGRWRAFWSGFVVFGCADDGDLCILGQVVQESAATGAWASYAELAEGVISTIPACSMQWLFDGGETWPWQPSSLSRNWCAACG